MANRPKGADLQETPGGFAGGLTTAIVVTVSVSIVALTAWTLQDYTVLGTTLLSGVLYTAICKARRSTSVASRVRCQGYERWAYEAGIVHQGVVVPLLGVAAAAIAFERRGVSWASWADGAAWVQVLEEGATAGTNWAASGVHCAILGYMLKDYVVYDSGLESVFVLHHLATILGCSLCLVVPAGFGLVTLNAVVAEFGSVFYNIKTLYPLRTFNHAVYLFTMGASNVLAVYIGQWFLRLPEMAGGDKAWVRYSYGALLVLLIIIRCGGWILGLSDAIAVRAVKKDY